jgi:hypothetical protein
MRLASQRAMISFIARGMSLSKAAQVVHGFGFAPSSLMLNQFSCQPLQHP